LAQPLVQHPFDRSRAPLELLNSRWRVELPPYRRMLADWSLAGRGPENQSVAFAAILGLVGAFLLLFSQWGRRSSSGAGSSQSCGANAQSAAEIRERRLAKLSAPGDLDDSWQGCFLDGGLAATLKAWRSQPFPTGALLLLLVEGPGDCLATQRLRKFLWPRAAPGRLSAAPTGQDEVLAARLTLAGGRKPGKNPPDNDAELLLQILGLKVDAAPLLLLLSGSPQVRAVHLKGGLSPEVLEKVILEAQEQKRKDWAEKGWREEDENQQRRKGVPMDMKALDRLRGVEGLHKKMAEDLLAAYSAAQAKDLVRRGVASPKDFVVEDVAVSLDTDAVAETTREQNVAERASREALRAEQAAEWAEAAAADEARREEERRKAEEEEREEEEAEAREVWARMDRTHRLEQLPPEPEAASHGVLALTVALPGSGRRFARRWRETDSVQMVADFAFGSATEEELPHAAGPPDLAFGFPRKSLSTDSGVSLAEAGVASREVLHALPKAT